MNQITVRLAYSRKHFFLVNMVINFNRFRNAVRENQQFPHCIDKSGTWLYFPQFFLDRMIKDAIYS